MHRLNETREEEAKRIAHALHDEASQLLAVVHIAVAELSQELPPSAQKHVLHISQLRAPAPQEWRIRPLRGLKSLVDHVSTDRGV